MQITNVKLNKGGLHIEFIDKDGDSIKGDYHEEPVPSFLVALNECVAPACDLLKFTPKWREGVVVQGVSKVEKTSKQGVSFLLTKSVPESAEALKINTPLVFEDETLITVVDAVLFKAEEYLGGVRIHQADLFPDEEEEEDLSPREEVVPVGGERENIRDALREASGRIEGDAGAAVLLGLAASTLRDKLRKYDIDKAEYRVVGVE